MVRVFGLQSGDQEFELGKGAQAREAGIFQEVRPAGEPSADAAFEPLKSSFAPPRQGKDASDLIIGVVCVPKRFRTRTGSGDAIDCAISFSHQGMEQTL